jgi:hypothetical protein
MLKAIAVCNPGHMPASGTALRNAFALHGDPCSNSFVFRIQGLYKVGFGWRFADLAGLQVMLFDIA